MNAKKIENLENELDSDYSQESNYFEIQQIFIRLFRNKCPVTIWQTDDLGNKHIWESYIKNIDLEEGNIFLAPIGDDKPFIIDRNLSIYLSGVDRNVLFKQDVLQTEDNSIIVKIPEEIKVYEKRNDPRVHYGGKSGHYSFVEFINHSEVKDKKKYVLPIYDISRGGIALMVKEDMGLKVGTQVKVSRVCDINLKAPLIGTIVYKSEYYNKFNDKESGVYMKFGISFNGQLSEDVFVQVKKK